MARLITGISQDKRLQRIFSGSVLPSSRRMAVRPVEEAVACGELKQDTDPELLIDALYGPLFFRWLMEHAPLDKSFAEALANKIIHVSVRIDR